MLRVIVALQQKALLVQCVPPRGRSLGRSRLELHTLLRGLRGHCEREANSIEGHQYLHGCKLHQHRLQQTQNATTPNLRRLTMTMQRQVKMPPQQLRQMHAHGLQPYS